jgi:D-alanyl-D-alanine carboxypeptidase (penicillin-binding protein 5/6)
MYPASTTKIMTAILAIENCKLTEKATVSQNAVDLVPSGYTNAKLVPGEKLTIKDLLYALMLNSANEAANVLAEHVSGSIEDFAVLMNKKAKELGCKNTNFLNANGMHNENHYTTAEDLAIIANYCMENDTFKEIVSTLEYELPTTELYTNNDRIMTNTNALINPNSQYYYEYAIGIKTGFTTQAGNCLVSCAEKDGTQLICVTLKAGSTTNNSSYRFADSKTLLEYGFENFSLQTLIKKDTIVDNIEVLNATKDTQNINVITKESISDFVSNDIDISNADIKINLNENISAPVYAGDTIGTVTYTINNKNYTTDLVSETSAYTSTNYTSYFLIIGLILLVVSIILIPKKKKSRHSLD